VTVRISDLHSDPLAVVREALLDNARRDAAATLADADAAASAVVAQARAEADALLAEARSRGEDDGAAVLAAEWARSAREARGLVLAERRAAYDALRQRARDLVSALREDPSYPALLEVLRQRVSRELGPDATLREHERGGIVGESAGRRVVFTLDDLADGIVDQLGDDLDELWAS
jgi:vacuolar-type H+-ATPase subunit E/Vma4